MGTAAIRSASTRAGVEMTLVWAFVGIRAIDLVQAYVATAGGALRSSTNVAAALLFLTAATLESAVVATWFIRRRSLLGSRLALWLDLAFAATAVAGMTLYSHPSDRIASWVAWSFAFTLSSAALAGLAIPRLPYALAASAALMAVYAAVTVLPATGHPGTDAATGAVNACAYPAFTVVSWFFSRFVRDLASEADSARALIADLERDRSRAVVHDMLGYLRLDRLMESDEQTRGLLVQQAMAKYRQMRSYVDGTDHPGDVESCLRVVAELYPALDLRLAVGLEPAVVLGEAVAAQLRQAVDTALSNVQQNAPKARVVLSACLLGSLVEVTVVDDGPGFDASTARTGFGISETLGRQLLAVGGLGQITARPGLGTEVRITVPQEAT